MTPISVVIITFNESRNIGRCLESIIGIADDIVVVDSYSTDNTEEICKSFENVRFIQHQFDGHIEQKNYAITQAKYPHVLSLDADEALDETLKTNILAIKDHFVEDGYEMNRLTNYCGKWVYHCSWYPDTKLRLWDSRKGKWTGTNPHDRYEMDAESKIKHIKGDILHYSYYTLEDHYKQVAYFTSILAKSQYQEGKKAPLLTLYFSPVVKFLRDYVLKLGFLDGATGFRICRISAYATFMKYRKLRNLIQSKGTTLN